MHNAWDVQGPFSFHSVHWDEKSLGCTVVQDVSKEAQWPLIHTYLTQEQETLLRYQREDSILVTHRRLLDPIAP